MMYSCSEIAGCELPVLALSIHPMSDLEVQREGVQEEVTPGGKPWSMSGSEVSFL